MRKKVKCGCVCVWLCAGSKEHRNLNFIWDAFLVFPCGDLKGGVDSVRESGGRSMGVPHFRGQKNFEI